MIFWPSQMILLEDNTPPCTKYRLNIHCILHSYDDKLNIMNSPSSILQFFIIIPNYLSSTNNRLIGWLLLMTYNSQNSIIEHIFHLEDSIHHCIVCIAELMNSRDRELCNLYIMKREYVERIRKYSYISVYRDICLSLLNLPTFQNNNI